MIESILFNYENGTITVSMADGSSKEYGKAQKQEYISDHPNRQADVVAMGW